MQKLGKSLKSTLSCFGKHRKCVHSLLRLTISTEMLTRTKPSRPQAKAKDFAFKAKAKNLAKAKARTFAAIQYTYTGCLILLTWHIKRKDALNLLH